MNTSATIVCGVTIGEFAFIGAAAVVMKDVEAYALVVGNPARRSGWMCRCGIKLPMSEGGDVVCAACGAAYRLERDSLRPV